MPLLKASGSVGLHQVFVSHAIVYVFGRGMCLKSAIGTGLINAGDIYKYSLPRICIYIYIKNIINIIF